MSNPNKITFANGTFEQGDSPFHSALNRLSGFHGLPFIDSLIFLLCSKLRCRPPLGDGAVTSSISQSLHSVVGSGMHCQQKSDSSIADLIHKSWAHFFIVFPSSFTFQSRFKLSIILYHIKQEKDRN